MMYNRLLDAFLAAADCGSFAKASEKVHVSTPAFVKQINQLEYDTGLCLFNRTHRGVSLTKSGEVFYEDAKFMVRYSGDALQRAKQAEQKEELCIRIGTSVMRSSKRLMDLWVKIKPSHPDFNIHIIPFEDTYQNYMETIKNLGRDIDVIAGIYPSDLWEHSCNVFQLTKLPVCLAVSRKHRLVGKTMLELSDLYGEKLMIATRGTSSYIDAVRDEVQKHPQIKIIDTPYYDVHVFNQCETTNSFMVTAEHWSEVHPMLVTIPVAWDFTVPYGLIYPLNPSKTVSDFMDAIMSRQDSHN